VTLACLDPPTEGETSHSSESLYVHLQKAYIRQISSRKPTSVENFRATVGHLKFSFSTMVSLVDQQVVQRRATYNTKPVRDLELAPCCPVLLVNWF